MKINRKNYKRIILYILVIALIAFSIAPFLWQALTSIRPDNEIAVRPTIYFPRSFTISHYLLLFARKPFALYFLNSFIVSGFATIACLILGSLAGYGFARMDVPARWLLLWAILAISIFPPIIFL